MANRDYRNKEEKKPKKKDIKAKVPSTAPAYSPVVEVIKKKRKEIWPED